MLMDFLRRSAVWLLLAVLPLLLIGLAVTLAVSRSTGDPQQVKDILKGSGLYASAVDGVLEATNNPNENGQGGITADNQVVKNAVKDSFTPELIQNSAENFIDGIYSWLEGKSSVPNFRIDLSQAKAKFVNEVAAGAQARAAGLPACPRGQNQFDDPFTSTCLPRGMSPAVAADKIRQELAGGQEKFLKDPVITADTVKNKEGRPVFSSDSKLPENYQKLKKMPLLFGLLVLITLAGIVFLSQSRRSGLKKAGVILLVVGLSVLVMTWLSNKFTNSVVVEKIKVDNSVLQEKMRRLATDVSGTFSKNFLLAGSAYATLGALAIAGSILINKRSPQVEAASSKPQSKDKPSTKPAK
jgi:hypothetical protein